MTDAEYMQEALQEAKKPMTLARFPSVPLLSRMARLFRVIIIAVN